MKKFIPMLLLAGILLSACQNQLTPQTPAVGNAPEQNTAVPVANLTEGEQGMEVIFYQGILADLSLHFAQAQLYTSALLKVDSQKISKEEWLKFSDQTLQKWTEAQQAEARFEEIANYFPDRAVAENFSPEKVGAGNLIPVAFAQDQIPISTSGQETSGVAGQGALQKIQETNQGGEVQVLNKSITQIIDKVPPKQMLQTAATLFNTDIKTAYTQLQELRSKVSAENYQWAQIDGDAALAGERLQTVSDIGLFLGGIATGGSELAVLGNAGKLKNVLNLFSTAISGSDLVFSLTDKAAQVGLISEKTGKIFSDASNADFLKYLKVWSSIKDVNKAISDYKELYDNYQNGKETLKRLAEMRGETVDDAALGKEAFINLLSANDKYKELIQGGIGNVQTSYDLGSKILDYLAKNPGAKSVSVKMNDDGTVTIQAGGNEPVKLNDQGLSIDDLQNNPQAQEIANSLSNLGLDQEVQLQRPAVPASEIAEPPVPAPVENSAVVVPGEYGGLVKMNFSQYGISETGSGPINFTVARDFTIKCEMKIELVTGGSYQGVKVSGKSSGSTTSCSGTVDPKTGDYKISGQMSGFGSASVSFQGASNSVSSSSKVDPFSGSGTLVDGKLNGSISIDQMTLQISP